MLKNANVAGASFLYWLDLVATILSFCGSLWLIICCLKAPSPKSLSLKLIAAVGIADFLYSIANLLSSIQTIGEPGPIPGILLCNLEAVLRQFSYVLTIFFSTCIAVASYFSIRPAKRFNKSLFFLCAVVLGITISILYITEVDRLFRYNFGISMGPFYCWFTQKKNHLHPQELLITMVYQGIPVIIGLIIALIAYTLAIKRMKETSRDLLEVCNINVYRVLWYPAVFFITFVPYVAVAVATIYVDLSSVWLNALFLYLPHSIGFHDALLYGIQARVYKTNYEEINNKTADLEEIQETSYEKYPYSESEERNSVKNALKEAYSN